jgi:hypothetical protein
LKVKILNDKINIYLKLYQNSSRLMPLLMPSLLP